VAGLSLNQDGCSPGCERPSNCRNAQSGAWYVIVTGNIDNAYPMCGPYWLQEYY